MSRQTGFQTDLGQGGLDRKIKKLPYQELCNFYQFFYQFLYRDHKSIFMGGRGSCAECLTSARTKSEGMK